MIIALQSRLPKFSFALLLLVTTACKQQLDANSTLTNSQSEQQISKKDAESLREELKNHSAIAVDLASAFLSLGYLK